MKTIQKLEIIAGAATLTMALLGFYFVIIPDMEQLVKPGDSKGSALLGSLLALIIPASLVLIGAYFHALRRSIVGLIFIIFFGGIMTLLDVLGFLLGGTSDGRVLLVILPGICAAITIIFAIYWQSVSSTPAEYAPPRR